MIFHVPKARTIDSLAASRAFVKSELPLLEKATKLGRVLNEGQNDFMMIGGVALRYYLSIKYKGKMGTGQLNATDVDMVLPEVPEFIKRLCEERPLAKPTFIYRDHGIVVKKNHAVGTVFQLHDANINDFPLFDNVCFFEKSIGRLAIIADDYARAVTELIELPLKSETLIVEVKFADLGLLLATMLTPDALTERRAKRAVLAIAANSGRMDEIAARYVDVASRSASQKDIASSLSFFEQVTKRIVEGIASAFVEEASKHVPRKMA